MPLLRERQQEFKLVDQRDGPGRFGAAGGAEIARPQDSPNFKNSVPDRWIFGVIRLSYHPIAQPYQPMQVTARLGNTGGRYVVSASAKP
jgi:hypothetical protein